MCLPVVDPPVALLVGEVAEEDGAEAGGGEERHGRRGRADVVTALSGRLSQQGGGQQERDLIVFKNPQ